MADLSPAAQAVLDAAMQDGTNPECYSREIAAAALRAAVDQVVPEDNTPGSEMQYIRDELLAIAAELES